MDILHGELMKNDRTATQLVGFLSAMTLLDPNLMILASIIGPEKFALCCKTFTGEAIRFPSKSKLTWMVKISRRFHYFFMGQKKEAVSGELKAYLKLFQEQLDHTTVGRTKRLVITQALFQSYFDHLLKQQDRVSQLLDGLDPENMQYADVVELYRLQIQEQKTNIGSLQKMLAGLADRKENQIRTPSRAVFGNSNRRVRDTRK